MAISVFDLFKIGIGPSSSHTVGPMKAARMFAVALRDDGLLDQVARVETILYGSLGLTGKGHGSDRAVLLGLEGAEPETVETDSVDSRIAAVHARGHLDLLGVREVAFDPVADLVFERKQRLPHHPNGMRFTAYDAAGAEVASRIYYSVGGGFVVDEQAAGTARIVPDTRELPYPYASGVQLLDASQESGLPVSALTLANERMWRPDAETREGLLGIWHVMQACVRRGCASEGVLPGGLKVPRRAARLYRQLLTQGDPMQYAGDPLRAMDWITLFALAVNEENAAGGRVVTAPTNGAAGIVPAVLHYYTRFVPGADDDGVVRFLLTAGAIGILLKENASISGAEVGCQGEVGSACSMAAAGLAEVLGATPGQVENAAEIAMEHNLGLTCDPIGGLVQVPCIERNAIAAVKAISSARMALRGDGRHFVSLDKVIKTMRDTGRDMLDKYKETSRGGLAVNVIEC
ncbi:MAG TPA: L-serine ammonia-lyase [Streptosporangiaceae bacterium]|jgi:L-serine dehydratase